MSKFDIKNQGFKIIGGIIIVIELGMIIYLLIQVVAFLSKIALILGGNYSII